ncbi:MAG: hypothetical protein Q7U10_00560 [Thermodesulfovibrionia bacterium]|nr:hypothetical protein [Thermodesulfovibrionia bacterium]
MPKTALDVTVKDEKGNVIFSKNEEFAIYDLHLPQNKEGYLGLNDWDITAMTHFDLGLEPRETESYTFVVPVNEGIKSVTVDASYSYLYEEVPGKSAVLKSVTNKVDFAK